MKLDGKVALVTGGASGIGRSAALALAREGAAVCIADLHPDHGRQVTDEIRSTGGAASFVQVDVRDSTSIAGMVRHVIATFGRLDFAHNNAGIIGEQADAVACTERQWHDVLEVNLTGVFLSMKHELPAMMATGGGSIVNMSSIGGIGGAPSSAAYIAAKHGVIGLTRSAAVDFGPRGVRVNAIAPGAVDTPMLAPALSGAQMAMDAMTARTPLRRIASPDEIASVVVWLCSDESAFVNGATIVVDGGQTIVV